MRQLFLGSVTVAEVIKGLEERHPKIRDQFHTNIGHKVQFVESTILVDVLLALRQRQIVALPVHDAVVVPISSVPQVRKVMEQVFEQHTGVRGVVRNEGRN